MKFTAQQIAELLNGEIVGNPETEVSSFAKIEEGEKGSLTFLHNKKYESFIYSTKASVCIVNNDFTPKKEVESTLIKVQNAYMALTQLLEYYVQHKNYKEGIEKPAYISNSAEYGDKLYLGAFSYLGENVKIGDNVKIYPNVYVGDNTRIGDDVTLYSGVQIYADTVIGNRCILHSNAVIGSDGFGFAPNEKGEYRKIPQIGNVVLEDDVEVGAGTTIDRSTMGSTRIKKGVKIDNHVQIAHNVEIDEHTAIAAQAGVAGSTKIGKQAVIGGQVGIAGHLKVGDQVKIQAQSGIARSVKDGEALQGSPAISYSDYNRSYVHFKNLSAIVNRLNELEKKLNKNES